ncbi:MAG: hypothetical protein HYT83_02330 [Candidatus Levybacteria bacterium]|nr:hypothetical protein [Candidatus Levybacteria bacterium]
MEYAIAFAISMAFPYIAAVRRFGLLGFIAATLASAAIWWFVKPPLLTVVAFLVAVVIGGTVPIPKGKLAAMIIPFAWGVAIIQLSPLISMALFGVACLTAQADFDDKPSSNVG